MTQDEKELKDLAKKYLDMWQNQWSSFLGSKTPADFKLWEEMLKQNYQEQNNEHKAAESAQSSASTPVSQELAIALKSAFDNINEHLALIENRLDSIEKQLKNISPKSQPRTTNRKPKKSRSAKTK